MPASPDPGVPVRSVDFAVIGGGIVGMATAAALQRRFPGSRLAVLEKERGLALHQTGRNSGVIHSGIYYAPGSLKARLARAGNRSMQAFCARHGIAHERCGKVIVATCPQEVPRLLALQERGQRNGLDPEWLDAAALRGIEPHVRGVAALRVPDAGIVDYGAVCRALSGDFQALGGHVLLDSRVERIRQVAGGLELSGADFALRAGQLVNCAGLHSDRVCALAGVDAGVRIVPFRGEYWRLRPSARALVRHLVYPVPDPAFPFLGVHFTRMVDGSVEAGPNAVLAFAREGYALRDVNLRDLAEVLGYGGFRHLARRCWRPGLAELQRSFSKAAFLRSLKQLIPDVCSDDLEPALAGVRAQALRPDGTLVDDFHMVRGPRSVHVCNAPSPAATASLEIGEHVAGLLDPP